MPDRHIDVGECIEYGQHFVNQAAALVGATKLVNVPEVIERVRSAMAGVASERGKVGVRRSGLRGGRTDIETAVADVRETLDRFFFYLSSLPVSTPLDFEAFFPGRVRGDNARLKPADLLDKLMQVQSGFSVPANGALPGAKDWQEQLSQARNTLSAAVSGKSSADTQSVVATSGLALARKRFLSVYNRVAKPAIRAALSDLGRENELKLFFRDLQVNESRAPGEPEETVEDGSEMPMDLPGTDAPETMSAAPRPQA